MAADEDVPVGVHLQDVPELAVHHHAAEEQEKTRSAVGSALAGAAGLLAGPGPTGWGSWGRRCSAAAREGTRWTPAGLGSSGSPYSRIRETCRLQKKKKTTDVSADPSVEPDFQGLFTNPPWCSPCRSRST